MSDEPLTRKELRGVVRTWTLRAKQLKDKGETKKANSRLDCAKELETTFDLGKVEMP